MLNFVQFLFVFPVRVFIYGGAVSLFQILVQSVEGYTFSAGQLLLCFEIFLEFDINVENDFS